MIYRCLVTRPSPSVVGALSSCTLGAWIADLSRSSSAMVDWERPWPLNMEGGARRPFQCTCEGPVFSTKFSSAEQRSSSGDMKLSGIFVSQQGASGSGKVNVPTSSPAFCRWSTKLCLQMILWRWYTTCLLLCLLMCRMCRFRYRDKEIDKPESKFVMLYACSSQSVCPKFHTHNYNSELAPVNRAIQIALHSFSETFSPTLVS